MNDGAPHYAPLLRVIAAMPGASLARVAKKAGLGQSQLLRLLAALGDSAAVDGLGWVRVEDGEPPRLHLTERGLAWLEQHDAP